LCGIVGYIGNPNQAATFDLVNQLMIKTEPRGEHATGFWAAIGEGDNQIIYHKEPVKSTVFVQQDMWQKHGGAPKPNLLIGHCRWTSPGGGPEKVNKNNHPHVSKDYRVALVHNGKIPEYNYLKKRYNVNTDCDSEVSASHLRVGRGPPRPDRVSSQRAPQGLGRHPRRPDATASSA
jgi:glucosamine--fructose-6-phosphate aminotransferase (isomerizing)